MCPGGPQVTQLDGYVPHGGQVVSSSVSVEIWLESPDVDGLFDASTVPVFFSV